MSLGQKKKKAPDVANAKLTTGVNKSNNKGNSCSDVCLMRNHPHFWGNEAFRKKKQLPLKMDFDRKNELNFQRGMFLAPLTAEQTRRKGVCNTLAVL